MSNDAPQPPDRPTPAWRIHALYAGGILLALFLGIGIGASGESDADTEPAAEQTPEPAPTVTETVEIDPSDAREAELDEREQELDDRESTLDEEREELDAYAGELDEREAEITETEETIAENTVTDGVWTVGVDIEPGTYRATDVSSDCYWGIYVTGTNQADIVQNGLPGGGNPTVTLSEGQDFESARCGEWTLQ